jgi:uncharacterized protein YyaL (SSP411 family)
VLAADRVESVSREVAVAGEPGDPATDALVAVIHRRYLPNRTLAAGSQGPASDGLPLLAGRTRVDGQPAAYVCRDYACRAPVTDPEELATLLDE